MRLCLPQAENWDLKPPATFMIPVEHTSNTSRVLSGGLLNTTHIDDDARAEQACHTRIDVRILNVAGLKVIMDQEVHQPTKMSPVRLRSHLKEDILLLLLTIKVITVITLIAAIIKRDNKTIALCSSSFTSQETQI